VAKICPTTRKYGQKKTEKDAAVSELMARSISPTLAGQDRSGTSRRCPRHDFENGPTRKNDQAKSM